MTNEQRKIISGLNALIRDRESFITNEDEKDNIFVQDKTILIEATELIKEQEKQVENTKALYDRSLSDLVKADKQIDLMAEELWGEFYLTYMNGYGINSKEELKQYFAGLVGKE